MNDKIPQDFLIAQQKTDQTFIDEIDELKKEIKHLKKVGIVKIRIEAKYEPFILFYNSDGDAVYTCITKNIGKYIDITSRMEIS